MPDAAPVFGEMVSDGNGGIIAAWIDGRAGTHYGIYAQRLNSQGLMQWPGEGVAIDDNVGLVQEYAIAKDGTGGAVIAWIDNSGISADVYAQRIDSTGTVLWTSGGVAVCADVGQQSLPAIAPDGAGGAIITWQDERVHAGDIYAQRIDAAGNVAWTSDGVAVCADSASFDPRIVSDGAGGACISWVDHRAGNPDIYAQRMLSDGSPAWTANGVVVCSQAAPQADHQLVADELGGAIAAWVDFRDPFSVGDIYAQRVNSAGSTLWATDGVAVCADSLIQTTPQLTPDGLGGAIVTWEDRRSDEGDIYAQRISFSGAALWTADGVGVCQASGAQTVPQITGNGASGAIICWQDDRGTSSDIYVQNLDSGGNALWTADGKLIWYDNTYDETNPRVVTDGAGGGIVAWHDVYGWSGGYAERVDAAGTFPWTGTTPICVAGTSESSPLVISDNAGGAIIAWIVGRQYHSELYVQRMAPNGNILWTATGTQVARISSQFDICSDGQNGVVLTWTNGADSEYDVYAQRFDGSGVPQWGNVVVVCDASGSQRYPKVTGDGAGGAIITWSDQRNPTYSSEEHIYAQRIDAGGAPLWAYNGTVVCDLANPSLQIYQTSPSIVSDGVGGAIIAWEGLPNEFRDDYDIFAQRVDASGGTLWTPNGEAVSSVPEPYHGRELHNFRMIPDDSSGAILVYNDFIAGLTAQRIASDGTLRWSADGLRVTISGGGYASIAPDDAGGVIIAWDRGSNIYAQRVSATGAILWAPDGEPVCEAADQQHNPEIAADGASGAVITWHDIRNGYDNSDIYAQRMDSDGNPRWTIDGEPIVTQSAAQKWPQIASDGFGGAIIAWIDERNAYGVIGDQIYADRIEGASCAVSRSSIDFGAVRLLDAREESFTIYNTSSEGSLLQGTVAETCDHFSIVSGAGLYSLAGGDSLVVTVRFEPAAEGPHSCTVETGDAYCSDVLVTGVGEPPVPCSVAPAEIEFEDLILVGTAQDTSFTIGYYGSTTVSGTVSESSPDFTITSNAGPFSLAPGESLVVGVRYQPGTHGVHRGLIQIDAPECNRRVLVADYGAGLQILDAGDPAVVSPLGIHDTPGQAYDVEISGTRAFVADNAGGLRIVDVSDPTTPTLLGFYDTPGAAKGLAIQWTTAYVADGLQGLQIIDVGDPAAPALLGTYDTPGLAQNVDVADTIACVANDINGLWVINVSDPTDPTLLGTFDTPGVSDAVEIRGSLAFVADRSAGLQVIDISDPASPTLVGTVDTPGLAVNVAVQRDLAFIADRAGGLQVIDISNPAFPAIVGTYNPGREVWDVAVEGSYVYLAAAGINDDIHVVDVLDPTAPAVVTIFDAPNPAFGIVVAPGADITVVGRAAPPYAVIDSISDVPNDQGGWVRVHFSRSFLDRAEETEQPIATYDIHRRIDSAVLAAAIMTGGETVTGKVEIPGQSMSVSRESIPGRRYVRYADRCFLVYEDAARSTPPGVWEVVGSVSARQQNQYIRLAASLGDSSTTEVPYTAFFISAHTTTPSIFYDGPVDSGYSVDNIPPAVPTGLAVAYNTGSGNRLVWDPPVDPDFHFFTVYRGTAPDFQPAPGNLVGATVDATWTDPDYDGWNFYYKVAAVDDNGNESAPAVPGTATHIDGTPPPATFALYQNAPNPFNPTTVIRYDVPAGGGRVTLRIYTVEGRLVTTLIDEDQTAGRKAVRWDGSRAGGVSPASGIYFYRMTAPGFVQTKKMVLLK